MQIETFFFKSFWRTHVLFWGHWYPCFGFLVTSPLGFKARVSSALFAIFAEANVMYISQDSPLVLHLPTCWQPVRSRCAAGHFPTCMCRGGTWLRFERATARTEDERATIVPATQQIETFNNYTFYFEFTTTLAVHLSPRAKSGH